MKIRTMRLLANEGASNVVKNKLMSLASIGTVIIALLLLGLVLLVAINIQSNMDRLTTELEVVVILNVDINEMDREGVKSFVEERQDSGEVLSWTYEDKATAFENLKKKFNNPALLKGMTKEQLPESLAIKLANPDEGDAFIEPLSKLPGIQPGPLGITYPKETLVRLMHTTDILNKVALALMGIMLVVSIFIISNTIRLTVFARRKEIEIMRHVGALDSFIRMPFFVEGIVIGVAGAFASFLITIQTYNWAQGTLNKLLESAVFGTFQLRLVAFSPVSGRILLLYFIIGTAIGGIGSLISVRKHLNV